ncbi:Ribonuclease HI [Bienertia sinuspersici]
MYYPHPRLTFSSKANRILNQATSDDRALSFFSVLKGNTEVQVELGASGDFHRAETTLVNPPHNGTIVSGRDALLINCGNRKEVAARKLQPYFEALSMVIRTDQPLEKALENMDASGQLVNWYVELLGNDLKFEPHTTIKAQALADFLLECSYTEEGNLKYRQIWKLYTDGSSTANRAGADLVRINSEGTTSEYTLKFLLKVSNNEAEYEAAIVGIELCLEAGERYAVLKTDSQLVAKEIRGEYETRDESMAKYLSKVKGLISKFRNFEVSMIPRTQNHQADALSKLASSRLTELNQSVLIEVRTQKSVQGNKTYL